MLKKLLMAAVILFGTLAASNAKNPAGTPLPEVPKTTSAQSALLPDIAFAHENSQTSPPVSSSGLSDEELAKKIAETAESPQKLIEIGEPLKPTKRNIAEPQKINLVALDGLKSIKRTALTPGSKEVIYNTYGYISKDHCAKDGSYEYNAIRIARSNGEYFVANIYGMDTLSRCTIDETAATITIPAQKIGYSSTYGDMWIMPIEWNGSQGTAKRNGNIVGTFNADGTISFGGWGVFVYEGPYAGAVFNYFHSSLAVASNASAAIVMDTETQTVTSLVEQPYPNMLEVYNLGKNGNPIQARVNRDGTITFTPQPVLSLNLYGDFYIYSYDAATNRINTTASFTATYSDGTLKIPPFAIVAKESTNIVWLKASGGATLTTRNFTLQTPESLEVKFEGEGTEASPYLIKNAANMHAFSQSVSDGNSYRGKYFRVANDFSMKGSDRAYQAAGDNENPFRGIFDGNGKTISDLEINGMGFNYQGVIGYLDTVGVVKNLTLDNLRIIGYGPRMGGVAGEITGKITNVHLKNSVIATKGDMIGGITGYSSGTISNCSYSGAITGNNYMGGLVGFNLFRIEKSWCDATLYTIASGNYNVNAAGGIVGTHYSTTRLGAPATVSECWYGGIIQDDNGYAKCAGIAAYCTGAVIEKSINIGIITTSNANNEAAPDDYDGSLTGKTYNDNSTGGIAAMVTQNTTVRDCVNAGTILKSKTSNKVGGIVGYLSIGYNNNVPYQPSIIENCVNTGYIKSFPIDERDRRGIFGATWVKNGYNIEELCVTNSYSDNQATGFLDTVFGKPSSFFTSGTLPQGFSSDFWKAAANRYMTLKAFEGTSVETLATANHAMEADQSVAKFKGPGQLYSDAGVEFWIYNNGSYVKSYDALSIEGNVAKAGTIYDNVLMVARATDGSKLKYMPVSVIPSTYEGKGTIAEPYILRTVEDFKRLNSGITEAMQPHNLDYFRLANDIDFQLGNEFNGFGAANSTGTVFGGTFDGDGHTIHRLKVKADYTDANGAISAAAGAYQYAGLFHWLTKTAVVKNLNIAADCQYNGYIFTGSIAGYNAGKIENCRNFADIYNLGTAAGGIAGGVTATGSVSNCYNAGNVTNGYQVAGGIAGYNLGVIELSQNDGNVTAKKLSGIYPDETVFSLYGGIAGHANGGYTYNCVNNGAIKGATKIGGINGGHSATAENGAMVNCVSTGLVETTNNSTNIGTISGSAEYNNQMGRMENLYFDKQINIVGSVANTNVEGTYPTLTSQLVAGVAPEGFDAKAYNFTAGKYPVLAKWANEDKVEAMRGTYMVLPDNENRANISSSATLSANQKLSWQLAQGLNFVIEGSTLKVNNNSGAAAQDTLRAYWDGKLLKEYPIGNVPAVFEGAGTKDDPYKIRTVNDLAKLAEVVNEIGMEYEGSFFKLMNDIAYTADDKFTPISMPNGSMKFQGTFDGDGHTISGYKYINTINYTGFFGTLGENATVKNLTLEGTMYGNMYTGGFTGKLYGTLENCVNKSVVSSSTSYAGGLVAYMYEGAVMKKCVNRGSVGEVKTPTGTNTPTLSGGLVAYMVAGSMDSCYNAVDMNVRSTAGGLASKAGGTISNSYNIGNITCTATAGGLVGNSDKTMKLYNCYNTGNVDCASATVGGLVGASAAASTVIVENCWNSGNIRAKSSVGGLFGAFPTGAKMRNCWNSGDVEAYDATNAGGLVGSGNGSTSFPNYISNCYNEGNIKGVKANVGGLCGNIANGLHVDSCVNYGKVTLEAVSAAGSVGGCVGNLSGEITNCWNAGEALSNSYSLGGIVGSLTTAKAHAVNCVNTGSVTSTAQYGNNDGKTFYGNAGGVVGSAIQVGNIINCANFGTVTAPDMVAGVIGAAYKGDSIINCYNAGKVVATSATPTRRDNVILFYGSTTASSIATPENVIMENLYYDSDVNSTPGTQEACSKALSTRALMDLAIPGFVNNPYCYPMLASMEDMHGVNLYSVGVIPEKEGDPLSKLTSKLYFGQARHLEFKCSDKLELKENGVIETKEKGEGKITITTTLDHHPMTREILVNIDKPSSGVNSVDADATPVSVKYYDLNGNQVAETTKGDVLIRITEFDNGTRSTEKIVIR